MLTITSNVGFPSGYQDQRNISNQEVGSLVSKNDDSSKDQKDTISISRKAQELQQVYEKKEAGLQQKYISDSQALEKKYIQEKNRLEKELSQKKQSLDINVYV